MPDDEELGESAQVHPPPATFMFDRYERSPAGIFDIPITPSNLPESIKRCEFCSVEILADESNMLHGPEMHNKIYCINCVVRCDRAPCTTIFKVSHNTLVGTEHWCHACISDYSSGCDGCGTTLAQRSLTRVNETVSSLCQDCLELHCWQCTCFLGQEGYFWNERYCEYCSKDRQGNKRRCRCGKGTKDNPIHDYSCKPNLVFHGKSRERIHMGFELETQINGGRSTNQIGDAARFAMNILQPLEIAQLKSDSSIGGGFEIVTQPHTYEKYREQTVLWEVIDFLRTDHRARSWDAGTCGLHIHISRNAFRDGLHTHRFIEFIYRNPEMMMKFAGRKSQRYAVFNDIWTDDEYDQPKFDVDFKIKKKERMSAVNCNNEDTLELRFFRGTMRPSGVLAALGLAHAMVQYTRAMTIDEETQRETTFAWKPFAEWVEERASEYPELMERMPTIKAVNLNAVPNIDA